VFHSNSIFKIRLPVFPVSCFTVNKKAQYQSAVSGVCLVIASKEVEHSYCSQTADTYCGHTCSSHMLVAAERSRTVPGRVARRIQARLSQGAPSRFCPADGRL